jgi:hypothetical protein
MAIKLDSWISLSIVCSKNHYGQVNMSIHQTKDTLDYIHFDL